MAKKTELENINLIRKIAWSYYKSTGIDFKELFSEASLAYCEALNKYIPRDDCKFTTFAWQCMRNHLHNFTVEERIRPEITFSRIIAEHMSEPVFEKANYQMESASEFLAQLPIDCQVIARIVLQAIDDLPDYKPTHISRSKIIRLMKEEGWTISRIKSGLKLMQVSLG